MHNPYKQPTQQQHGVSNNPYQQPQQQDFQAHAGMPTNDMPTMQEVVVQTIILLKMDSVGMMPLNLMTHSSDLALLKKVFRFFERNEHKLIMCKSIST